MGTRNLTCVVLNDEFKIAQYGQFDGYPVGVGVGICEFLQTSNLDTFKDKVSKLTFTDNEYPDLIKLDGPELLKFVLEGNITEVPNNMYFASDSLFCEWAYVIDLDNNKLEIYKGFQQKPPTAGRFINVKPFRENYYPVSLVATLDFKDCTFNKMQELGRVLDK